MPPTGGELSRCGLPRKMCIRDRVCEGKYHQVRRMMAARGMTVTYLERRQEGSLTLGDLPRGQARELTEVELAALEQGE